MIYSNPPPSQGQFPRVPLERRAYAYLLDFVAVWLLSSLATGWLQDLIFLALWWALRVVVVVSNQGQSLGAWAFDLKVMNLRFRRLPSVLDLSKREGILGGFSLLAMIGLKINFLNAISMLLFLVPLAIDAGLALGDENMNQALHDRLAGTVVIRCKRGFSLDLRLKRWSYWLRAKLAERRRR